MVHSVLNLADKTLELMKDSPYAICNKKQKFVDNLNWIYPTPILTQSLIASSELQYFSVDGFSLGE